MKLRDNVDVVTAITLAFVEIINDLRYIWENINKEDSVKFQNTLVKIIKNPINQKDIRFRSE